MIPIDPPNALLSNYELLYAENSNFNNLQKILELKGLKRSEQQPILDKYEKRYILKKAKNKENNDDDSSLIKTNSNSNSSTKISAMNIISNFVGQTPNQLSNSLSSASSSFANTFIPKHLLINKLDTDRSLSANGPMSASVINNSSMPHAIEIPRRGSSNSYMSKNEVNFSNSDSASLITKHRTTSFSSPAPYTTTKSESTNNKNRANHLNIITNIDDLNNEDAPDPERRDSIASTSSVERAAIKFFGGKKPGFISNTSSPTSNKLMMMNEKLSKWIKRDNK